MNLQRWTLLALVPFVLPSCAARYQDLLRQRDAEIRQLESENADLRATNEELSRLERDARRGADVINASAGDDRVQRLQDRLPDLDVRRKGNRVSIGVPNTVTFDSGSHQLKRSAGSVLQNVARVLRSEFATESVVVEGHTDSDPIRKSKYRSNRHLSLERADAVASYLIRECGIPDKQVVVVGYGQHQPRQPGRANSAKARNRRVEIVVGDFE